MYRASGSSRSSRTSVNRFDVRLRVGMGGLGLLALLVVGRLFQLQILEGKTYRVLASDQHVLQAALVPKRGTIYVKERGSDELHPLVQDRDAWQMYAVPREIKDAT